MTGLRQHEVDVARAIASARNGISSADRIANILGYRPARAGRLAVSSTLRSLQRRGLVGRIPPKDQWASAAWFLTEAGSTTFARTASINTNNDAKKGTK